LSDILREADSSTIGKKHIESEDIKRTIKEKKFRRNLVEEKIRELINEGKIIIDVEGKEIGQVNGIAVYDIGDYSFGKPSRITASVYIGEKGIVNIEREVELSGPIHSKGVMILSGYIGRKYGKDVPLAISCSIAFEQSYGEVEGDSASAAELLAVLSEISEIPIKQNFAITGSIDQHGNIQPVGGIKEKIEGFYYTCKHKKFTGNQGVIVPARNFSNIILEDEILESISKNEFSIYTVENIDDCIKLLTDVEPLQFHKKVLETLEEFYKKVIKHRE
jgi:predicted ATP-dependent protease